VGATGVAQLIEVWTQLRGTAGERQIPNGDVRVGLAHNLGGTGGTSSVTLLELR
jgi:acetyl-CoA acetyltransferase